MSEALQIPTVGVLEETAGVGGGCTVSPNDKLSHYFCRIENGMSHVVNLESSLH